LRRGRLRHHGLGQRRAGHHAPRRLRPVLRRHHRRADRLGTAGADRRGRRPGRRDLAAGRQAASGARPRHLLHRGLRHLADRVARAGAGQPCHRAGHGPEAGRREPRADLHTPSDATVEAIAYDGQAEVGSVRGQANRPLQLPVPNPKLWSPDSPFLYDLKVRVLDGEETVDEVDSYFGMREIGTKRGADGKLRMTLNGQILFHLATLDQGYWPDGIYTAPTDEALAFD